MKENLNDNTHHKSDSHTSNNHHDPKHTKQTHTANHNSSEHHNSSSHPASSKSDSEHTHHNSSTNHSSGTHQKESVKHSKKNTQKNIDASIKGLKNIIYAFIVAVVMITVIFQIVDYFIVPSGSTFIHKGIVKSTGYDSENNLFVVRKDESIMKFENSKISHKFNGYVVLDQNQDTGIMGFLKSIFK